jgi:hypothetical protein
MATTMNIMQVCETVTQALRQRGFFDADQEDAARAEAVGPAVEAASAELGTKLTVSEHLPNGGCTVLAEGIPGVVTIVSQRRIDDPDAKGDAQDSINPDFGVTWAIT